MFNNKQTLSTMNANYRPFLYFGIVLVLLSSCSSSLDVSLLNGEWKVAAWKVVSSGKAISQKMDFNFNADKTYVIDYGSQKETGTFYLSGQHLHTKENGGIEKSVRIKHLTRDSMILDMNRAGSLEEIILVRPLR